MFDNSFKWNYILSFHLSLLGKWNSVRLQQYGFLPLSSLLWVSLSSWRTNLFLHQNFFISYTPQSTNYTATCLPSRKLYKLDEPDTQGTAGEARTSSSVICSCGLPHVAKEKQVDQLKHRYSSYVRIRDVALKTSQKQWMIGRIGERGSGISVLAARHDDDDDDVDAN